jgi:photosystem II stability/assembly factor-like uncharacterized protein
VEAQYVWKLTYADNNNTDSVQNSAWQVSCNGENCTAAFSRYDSSLRPNHSKLLFYRSNDGGRNWSVQDPGFPLTDDGGSTILVIDQIDSLNVVAAGVNGLVLRTFDGGKTWEKQQIPVPRIAKDIHFSDPMTGIIAMADPHVGIYYTHDGGRNWKLAPLDRPYVWQCHSDGGPNFRAYMLTQLKIYETHDDWQTFDSIGPILDTIIYPLKSYSPIFCNFSDGDTMVVYGTGKHPSVPNSFGFALTMRSVDRGVHWEQPIVFDSLPNRFTQLTTMSPLNSDTIIAGSVGEGGILVSTDRGGSWHTQRLMFDTGYVPTFGTNSLARPSDGGFVGLFSPLPPFAMLLARGEIRSATVHSDGTANNSIQLFPNPTTDDLNISYSYHACTVIIFDVLGREVLHGTLDARGQATLDVSRLSPGIYNVMIERDGAMVSAGKVAVVAK